VVVEEGAHLEAVGPDVGAGVATPCYYPTITCIRSHSCCYCKQKFKGSKHFRKDLMFQILALNPKHSSDRIINTE